MNILPQILKISSKNYLVNHFVDEFKKKIEQLFEEATEKVNVKTINGKLKILFIFFLSEII